MRNPINLADAAPAPEIPLALAGRVALVIGAGSGIGRATAEALGAAGASVAVGYFSQASTSAARDAADTLASLCATGASARSFDADLARPESIRGLYEAVIEAFGRIDIVVNAAGVARYRPVSETTEDDFDFVFAVNARGTFFSLREAARHVADGGRIVSLSSGSASTGAPLTAIYAGSKAAVEQFTRSLASELAPRGVTVNAVAPGFTDTAMLRENLHIPRELAASLSPFKRLGAPREVADAVLLLCLPQAGWLTGQTIQAGGGVIMR